MSEYEDEYLIYFISENEESCQASNVNEIKENENVEVKTKKRSEYSKQDLMNAIKEVKDGDMILSAASRKYKIPRGTITNHLSGRSKVRPAGRSMLLSEKDEKDLVEWLMKCDKLGDYRTKQELLKKAAKLASLKDINYKRAIPTHAWYKAFMKRHPEIGLRKPLSSSASSLPPVSSPSPCPVNSSAPIDVQKIFKDFEDCHEKLENHFKSIGDASKLAYIRCSRQILQLTKANLVVEPSLSCPVSSDSTTM